MARKENVDFILGVGGGSTVDYCKAVAGSAWYDGDPWEYYFKNWQPMTCRWIPVGCVLTMAGTGSEMDSCSVISSHTENRKLFYNFRNPDFADGNDGWEGTTFSATPGTVAEHYNQLFDTYQVLSKMPAGSYRLSWQGFYRNGNIQNAWLRHTAGLEDTAEVYVAANIQQEENGKWYDLTHTAMQSLYASTVPYTYEPFNYPDNVSTADKAFTDGYYTQYLDFDLPVISDVRIGLRHFTPTVYDWACVDNFNLIYYSNGTLVKRYELLEDEDRTGRIYDLSGRIIQHSSLQKGIYIMNAKKVLFK